MNRPSTLEYYSNRAVQLMNAIENKTGKMFHDTHNQLENDWYKALDAKDMPRIVFLHNELCKVYDKLSGEFEE